MFLLWIVGLLLLGYVTMLGSLTLSQRRLIFPADRSSPEPSLMVVPGSAAMTVTASDGQVSNSWYLASASATAPVVLYLHGNGGHIGYRARRLERFAGLGWGALLLEYRGYGSNAGKPSETGLLTDARAGLAQLIAMGIAPSRIVVWGESLGSNLAVRLAAENPVGAVVLEAPFTSLLDVVNNRMPWVPARFLLRYRFDSLAAIDAVRSPLIILAGGRDTLVPPMMSRRLFEAAHEPKEFLLQAGKGHNELGGDQAFAAVVSFLAKHGMAREAVPALAP